MEKIIIGFILLIVITVLLTLNVAYPMSLLYEWFLMPLGAPEIAFNHFIGILLLIGLLRHRLVSTAPVKYTATDYTAYIVVPWIALGIGWLLV